MAFEIISVVGLGYIGLPTAAMFASQKKKVIGVDVNQNAVDTINEGKIHFFEPDLDLIVATAVNEGYLRASISVEPADAFLIAVPTPFLQGSKQADIPQPDLTYIEAAAKAVAAVLKKGDLVILESTSPVGTTERMAEWLAMIRPDLTFPKTHGDASDIRVAYCPERVLPGNVVRELVENDRIIGGLTNRCSDAAIALYKTFVMAECVSTNARTAEMSKLTENSCRDVQLAFANELSIICDKLNIDVWELISLANRHPRINILQPGPGVGGHCIAVDPWFIISKTPNQAPLMHCARKVNDAKPYWVLDKIKIAITDFLEINPKKTVEDITIACYGLAYKPDIDDLRESPALRITESISKFHAGRLIIFEPNITELPFSLSNKASLVNSESTHNDIDITVILVDHSEFKLMDIDQMNKTFVIDTRGLLR
jgi:UDP-N-acetyl-D-mannosaminuronic acid dehydrogenase